jgi:hypothetical protein
MILALVLWNISEKNDTSDIRSLNNTDIGIRLINQRR